MCSKVLLLCRSAPASFERVAKRSWGDDVITYFAAAGVANRDAVHVRRRRTARCVARRVDPFQPSSVPVGQHGLGLSNTRATSRARYSEAWPRHARAGRDRLNKGPCVAEHNWARNANWLRARVTGLRRSAWDRMTRSRRWRDASGLAAWVLLRLSSPGSGRRARCQCCCWCSTRISARVCGSAGL
ncbi:hypothetical protein BC834DRAFT_890170 [Gloeopeniophorella convolvens]|nr:hypothetical protein BC834DRAFT_890170 [Gloeopeniophorella convolvens]